MDKILDFETKRKMIEDAKFGIFVKDESKLYNPLIRIPEELEDRPELYFTWILSRPEYFWFTCKHLLNVSLHPMQAAILYNMWNHKFPMLVGSRGMGKSFLLAVYALLRILLLKNRKVIICGSGFRQSKIIFGYMENIIANSPILKKIITQDDIQHSNDNYKMKCGNSFAMAIPIGTGETIRGLRANDVIADEFASISVEIFETVIAGFAAVSSSPTEQAARIAARKFAKHIGFEIEDDKELERGNQIIISGTASYSFNHFSAYHDRYKKFIKSRGNYEKMGISEDDWQNFNHEDFCIMRIPVTMIPEGFMDASQVSRAKATVHSGIYQMEYGAVFSSDSNGFYKRSTIENCVVKEGEDIVQPNGNVITAYDAWFSPKIKGDKDKTYVMGVDPAMTQDNFSIVILEICNNCRKVVYCWTTNKEDHNKKLKDRITTENNYYAYCARKIRDIMDRFNITDIAIDAQGGGRSVMEAINDKNLLSPGEIPIWPVIDYSSPKDTDGMKGLHILEPVQFTREDWTSKANHGLKKDMEDKVLLFPFFDAISLIEAEFADVSNDDDNLLKVIEEIEELKNELSTITVTQTAATNRERWDTPELKLPNGKKGRMRKDRYSSLLMANMTARTNARTITHNIEFYGGKVVGGISPSGEQNKDMYYGPQCVVQKLSELYSD